MAELRQETHFLRDSLIAGEAIDTTDHDLMGRLKTGGKAYLCAADETPQFIFMESASADQPVSVAFLGMGPVKIALSGTGNAGDKLSVTTGGKVAASGTSQSSEPDEDDIGIALDSWSDGVETECFLIKGSKV